MLNMAMDAPLRGVGTPDKEFGYYDATVDGGWDMPGEPYTMAEGSEFMWWRSRMLGGRTNHWARNSFRMGEYDFKPNTRDGLGVDWPIDYKDIAPWYDRREKLVGVYGTNTGLENHPSSGPGVLQPPPKFRVWETFLKAGGDAINIPVVAARRAILTKKIDERSPCYWASGCGRGCGIGAAFQTTTSLIPWAKATGKLTIATGAMVYEVLLDATGKATGVRYIDKATGAHKEAKGRVVVIAASTGETARILLNYQAQRPLRRRRQLKRAGRSQPDGHGRLQLFPPTSRNSKAARATTKTAPWAFTPTSPSGTTSASPAARSIRRAAITSRSVARSVTPAWASAAASMAMAHSLRCRRQAPLWLAHRLHPARRDDPERQVVLRDRHEHEGQVRHPRSQILLRLVRSRAETRSSTSRTR